MNDSINYNKKKVILITPMLQPYRISFYDKLSKRLENKIELIKNLKIKILDDNNIISNSQVLYNLTQELEVKELAVQKFNRIINDIKKKRSPIYRRHTFRKIGNR